MVDLDFLSTKAPDQHPSQQISTGKTYTKEETQQAIQNIPTQPATMNLVLESLPFYQATVDFASSLGLVVINSFKDAIECRGKGDRVCTYREADILFRKSIGETGSAFLVDTLMIFGAFMVEDCPPKFPNGIFHLRTRYNRGLQWLAKRPAARTDEQQEVGVNLLNEIRLELYDKKLPLFPYEKENGFHQEFLKPEYLTFRQFEVAMKEAEKIKQNLEGD